MKNFDDYKEWMDKISSNRDEEGRHVEADDLLMEIPFDLQADLITLDQVKEIHIWFRNLYKWYA